MPTATFRIRRLNPDVSPEPYWQEFEAAWGPGDVVLEALHAIQESQDGTLAYRYSCRGAICGSCAVRINGTAALACKTQIASLDAAKPIVLEPLLNSPVIKDLVVDQEPFFASLRNIMPWLDPGGRDPHEHYTIEGLMSPSTRDQFLRATDCIMCQCCFSDCPKRLEDPRFVGPATCLAAYKRIHHPQEPAPAERLRQACQPGGIGDCDRHTNCVKVCPKDCRPMRAIMFLQREAKEAGIAPE
ncbi:MAG: 2Fe-2S iron-sulfur cluster binding domain-containing protein [Planctomycetes bacterium]|nr:2Fe-2S iron-sulfur cluster binding domain-containing protein [Planctomycetota bacterium]